MNKKSTFFLIGVAICTLIIMGFSTLTPKTTYQHMLIIAKREDVGDVYISIDGKDYSVQKRLKRESQGAWDMNPVINLIHEYEGVGWELQSFSGNGEYHEFWLRRTK